MIRIYMKYGFFAVNLLLCNYLFGMDDEDLMLETEESLEGTIDSAQPPNPPEDLADFEAVVEFLRTLQNNKTCGYDFKREQVQKAYQRYYLCPSFARAGGKKVLVLLADELDIKLQFSCRQAGQTLRFSCQDVRAVGKYMAIFGTIGGLSVVLYWLDAKNAAMDAVTVSNSSSYYAQVNSFTQPCLPCTESWVHDGRKNSYYPVPHSPGVANCSDILDIVNQTLHEISAACLNKVRPFFWIDAKNYFQVTCWRGGFLMFDRCNIDQVKSYVQDQVASSYQFAMGFTGMLTAIPAAIYCVISAIDGGCSYASKKIYRAYQYCRVQTTAKSRVEEEEEWRSPIAPSFDPKSILLDEDEDEVEEEDEV